MSKPGAQILGGTADKGTSQENAAGGPRWAAAMRQRLPFRGYTGAAAPLLRARYCLLSLFPPDAYKSPLVSSECDIQS